MDYQRVCSLFLILPGFLIPQQIKLSQLYLVVVKVVPSVVSCLLNADRGMALTLNRGLTQCRKEIDGLPLLPRADRSYYTPYAFSL